MSHFGCVVCGEPVGRNHVEVRRGGGPIPSRVGLAGLRHLVALLVHPLSSADEQHATRPRCWRCQPSGSGRTVNEERPALLDALRALIGALMDPVSFVSCVSW